MYMHAKIFVRAVPRPNTCSSENVGRRDSSWKLNLSGGNSGTRGKAAETTTVLAPLMSNPELIIHITFFLPCRFRSRAFLQSLFPFSCLVS